MLNRVFYLAWLLLSLAALADSRLGLLVQEATWVLRPMPLILVLVWVAVFWPGDQPRRLWFCLGLAVFGGLELLEVLPETGITEYYLALAGLLLYIGWSARGISMEPARWVLVVPLIAAGLFALHFMVFSVRVPAAEALPYLTLLVVLTLCLLLSPYLHPAAFGGGLLLAFSYVAPVMAPLAGAGEWGDAVALGSTYAAHLLLGLGAVLSEPLDEEAREDIARVAHVGPQADQSG